MSQLPELYIDDNGIFREYHYDKIISKSCAMYIADERNRLSTVKRPLIVQFKNLEGYAVETRDLSLNFVLQSVNALVYLLNSDSEANSKTKEIIESFFYITKWPVPVNIFSKEKDAIDWLLPFVPDNKTQSE